MAAGLFPFVFLCFSPPHCGKSPGWCASDRALPVRCHPAVLLGRLPATPHPAASRQGAPGHGLCMQVSDIVTATGTAVRPGRRLMASEHQGGFRLTEL